MLQIFCTLMAALSETGFIVKPSSFMRVSTHGNSSLYAVKTAHDDYVSGDVQLLDLHGTRHEQGYAFGKLGGKAALSNYNALLGSLIDTKSIAGRLEKAALEVVIDWQWRSTLSKQVPTEMVDELVGFAEGCKVALPLHIGSFCERVAGRMQTLANLPGDVDDIVFVLIDELPRSVIREAEALLAQTGQPPRSLRDFLAALPWPLAQCSMFALWGSRTQGGGVLSGRNLDWNHDTGINRNKLITVFHPPEAGRHAHATFGFGGLVGALAGMSAAGLTTHEANLESNRDSFRGFPWLLRLRYVLERASDLQSAKEVWLATNNTVGFNHMVASAKDRAALVIETNAITSAFFRDDDPREKAAAFAGATLPEPPPTARLLPPPPPTLACAAPSPPP